MSLHSQWLHSWDLAICKIWEASSSLIGPSTVGPNCMKWVHQKHIVPHYLWYVDLSTFLVIQIKLCSKMYRKHLTERLPKISFNLQVVRSRLQEQGYHSEKQYAGVFDCIKKVFQKEGIPGFYRGCATNLLRTTPAAVITFTSFEMIHRFLVAVFPPESQPHTL